MQTTAGLRDFRSVGRQDRASGRVVAVGGGEGGAAGAASAGALGGRGGVALVQPTRTVASPAARRGGLVDDVAPARPPPGRAARGGGPGCGGSCSPVSAS
ncbi:hypothetical protein [Micromonospora sp. S4605]|uniref:hypothetical protein n=1 Tax=Micromonospora sp. S4605 TaxID=1420897 RepID=UPI001305444D|nr:hypothetical protein [Micromonospora sp. S4605]